MGWATWGWATWGWATRTWTTWGWAYRRPACTRGYSLRGRSTLIRRLLGRAPSAQDLLHSGDRVLNNGLLNLLNLLNLLGCLLDRLLRPLLLLLRLLLLLLRLLNGCLIIARLCLLHGLLCLLHDLLCLLCLLHGLLLDLLTCQLGCYLGCLLGLLARLLWGRALFGGNSHDSDRGCVGGGGHSHSCNLLLYSLHGLLNLSLNLGWSGLGGLLDCLH